jgi:S-adenosylmethionine-diacylgycerolhomoserine-N-methlytransferase
MKDQGSAMRGYYRFHARIYESTRWIFLFGRNELIKRIRLAHLNNLHAWEIGCGTGKNLVQLERQFPNMTFTGFDVSPDMLAIARKKMAGHEKKIQFLELAFGTDPLPNNLPTPNLILISYCLTMVNPGWEKILQQAYEQLPQGGKIAVVDFNESPVKWFKSWMKFNHVRMDGHLPPALEPLFKTLYVSHHKAYGGLWSYFIYVGVKK